MATGRKKISISPKQTTQARNVANFIKEFDEYSAELQKTSVSDAFMSFLLDRKSRNSSKATLDAYERFYKKLIAHYETIYIGDGGARQAPVGILSGEYAQILFVRSLGEVSPQTVNHYLRSYKAFGNFCLKKGLIPSFECHIKDIEPPIKEVYTNKELELLLVKPKDTDDFTVWRNHAIITLLLATGARSNTILNLRISELDLESGYVNYNVTKAHKTVRLALDAKALQTLLEYVQKFRSGSFIRSKNDYVFCNQYGEQMVRSGLDKAIRTYNKSRGVEKTSIHLFRHTFAKNWITSGGDIITLAKVLTHSDLEMVKKYSNLYNNDVKQALEEHSTLSQLRQTSGQTLRTKSK